MMINTIVITQNDELMFHPSNRYPPPLTVTIRVGVPGSSSIFCLNHRTCTSTVRLSPIKSQPQTRSRINSRDSICPLCAAKNSSNSYYLGFSCNGSSCSVTSRRVMLITRSLKDRVSCFFAGCGDFSSSSFIRRVRRNCALTRAINSRIEKGLVR